jgi:hypothetical protein
VKSFLKYGFKRIKIEKFPTHFPHSPQFSILFGVLFLKMAEIKKRSTALFISFLSVVPERRVELLRVLSHRLLSLVFAY